MGMDVYGKAATKPEGEYFRNSVWWWRPLANYIIQTAPEMIALTPFVWSDVERLG